MFDKEEKPNASKKETDGAAAFPVYAAGDAANDRFCGGCTGCANKSEAGSDRNTGLKASWDKPETTGGLDIFEYKVTLYGHFDGIAGEKTEVETKTVQRETTCTFTNTGNAEGVINPNYEVEVKAREGVSAPAIRTIWGTTM